jgi:hypothetical protein
MFNARRIFAVFLILTEPGMFVIPVYLIVAFFAAGFFVFAAGGTFIAAIRFAFQSAISLTAGSAFYTTGFLVLTAFR